jgi:hypothetical protein
MTSLIQDIKAMEEGGFSSEEISNFKKIKFLKWSLLVLVKMIF